MRQNLAFVIWMGMRSIDAWVLDGAAQRVDSGVHMGLLSISELRSIAWRGAGGVC